MYSMNKIKFTDDQQSKAICNFKDIKKIFCRAKVVVWLKYVKYVLDLWFFVVIKLPEDDNLVPKHVGVGT